MTNIKCEGRHEIDLLAINPKKPEKYHVESTCRTSRKSVLRQKELDTILESKFRSLEVTKKIHEIFGDSSYKKILVVWDASDDLTSVEPDFSIRKIMPMISRLVERTPRGSRDDILRLAELMNLAKKKEIASFEKRYELDNNALLRQYGLKIVKRGRKGIRICHFEKISDGKIDMGNAEHL